MSSDLTSAGGGSGITALTADVTASGSGSQPATIPTSVISTFMRTVTDDANGPAALATLGYSTGRVTVQFDTTDQTFAAVPGLTRTLLSGHVYDFRVHIFQNVDGTGAAAVILGGTVVADMIGEASFFNPNTGNAETLGTYTGFAGTAKSFSVADAGLSTMMYFGTIAPTVTGTLNVQYRQPLLLGAPSSVLIGSSITIRDIT